MHKHIDFLNSQILEFEKKDSDYRLYVKKLFEGKKGDHYEKIVSQLVEYEQFETNTDKLDARINFTKQYSGVK